MWELDTSRNTRGYLTRCSVRPKRPLASLQISTDLTASRIPAAYPTVAMDPERKTKILRYIDSAIAIDPKQPTDVTKIPESHIQDVLDELWNILETPSEPENFDIGNRQIPLDALRRLSLKLATTYHKLPTTFHLRGVKCVNMENLSSGTFADIYREQWGDQVVALKRLRTGSNWTAEEVKRLQTELYRESFVWGGLHHKHILKFLGVSYDAFESSACMVLPWLEYGDIRRYINTLRDEKALPVSRQNFVSTVNNWLLQITLGLTHLHAEGIVHGNLHGGNILIDTDGSVRLTDFGFGLITEATARNYGSKHGGAAIGYSAPELLAPRDFNLESARPSRASDMYAFASTCYELYSGHPPFSVSNRTQFEVSTAVVRGDRPPKPLTAYGDAMPEPMWSLTQRCWDQLAAQRPPAQTTADFLKVVTSGERLDEGDLRRAGEGLSAKVEDMNPPPTTSDHQSPLESHTSSCSRCRVL